MSMIKAVLFDVGSTLIDPQPEIDGVFYEVATSMGHRLDREVVSGHLPAVLAFYEEEYLKDGDFWCSPQGAAEMYLEMYRYLSHLTGLGTHAEPLAQAVNECYLKPAYWRIIGDALPCLKELKEARLRLGVVSNWASNLDDLLRGLMMGPYFDEVVSSAEVGYRKPNPMIFTLMLERMGISADEAVHVGDRPDADGVGAKQAGITPVIIDRARRFEGCGYLCIESLGELLPLVRRLSAVI